ncbi:HNH endonuclease [Desulfococcaceae bacterium HSG8]|nr:HNH endonuclease [Desulfococcaceae bacterium HSG8]
MESQLHQEMIDMFYIAGKETGYWGSYFLRSVKNNGGLQTAKKMLSKRLEKPSEQKGFQALIEAGRPDLSLESLVLQPRFRELFTTYELDEAKRRLASIPEYAKRVDVPVDENHADDIVEEQEYSEGSKKRITVNAYEREPKARAACLKRHGFSCKVCGMNFKDVYGSIGKHFIHVHHRKPLAGRRSDYKVNPTKDLVPVCPNCHSMLHTSNPPLGIEELKEIMANK